MLPLLDHFIARVERLDPQLHAIVVHEFERARETTRAQDARSDRSAPLFGMPITVKEGFDLAVHPSTWGVLAMRDAIATSNTLAVQRLIAAGAVVVGKSNVPPLLGDWQSTNAIDGSTNNPWDLSRMPGGSSGGSAAALAAGLTGLEIGCDIGSSIRNPGSRSGGIGSARPAGWQGETKGSRRVTGEGRATPTPTLRSVKPLDRPACGCPLAPASTAMRPMSG